MQLVLIIYVIIALIYSIKSDRHEYRGKENLVYLKLETDFKRQISGSWVLYDEIKRLSIT